jgi:plastocyanin
MRRLILLVLVVFLVLPARAFADAAVVEGDEAVKLYQADKGKAQTLVQKGKEFILRAPDGKETSKPESMTVKVGERFYVSNEEMEFVHNIYDMTDSSWVLKKQEPSKIAAITFTKSGEHNLRCAIHPMMKIKVNVLPK